MFHGVYSMKHIIYNTDFIIHNTDNGVAQKNKIYPIKFMFTVKISVNVICKDFSDLS